MHSRYINTVTVCVLLCIAGNPVQAQPRSVIDIQEAQTPPRIDREQLLARPAKIDESNGTVPSGLAELQQLAQSPASQNAQTRKEQAEAAWQLGLLHLHGLHVALDPVQARALFAQAYEQGYSLAAAGLVWCAIDGCGQRPHPEEIKPWLAQLRIIAPGRAAYFDWLLLEDAAPLDDDMTSTAPQANRRMQSGKRQTLHRAVQANDAQARVEWGLDLAEQGKPREAMAQFRIASNRSEAARRNLDILNQQNSMQIRPAGNAGQGGGAWQTFRQARMYHRGEGVPANYTEAIRLYKRASDMGNAPAKRMLALIFSRPQADGSLDIAWMQQLAYADVSEDSNTPILAPSAPASLQRDPTPLYDYIDARWRR